MLLTSAIVGVPGASLASATRLSSKRSNQRSGQIRRTIDVDVAVYGASASGIMAAVAAAREGRSVALIEPTHRLGGVLASGFRVALDVPDPHHLGGLAREFYDKDVALHRGGFQVETLRHYQSAGVSNTRLFRDYLEQYGTLIASVYNHRIVSADTHDGRIRKAIFEYALADEDGAPPPSRTTDDLIAVRAKVFIDASYEADLMALAGVSYRIGRESRQEYGESLAGVLLGEEPHNPQVDVALDGKVQKHAFPGVDPYVIEGDPHSGILSPIDPRPIGPAGSASPFFMGWNFKLAWETDASGGSGALVRPPKERNEAVYELLRRYVRAGYKLTWPFPNWHRGEMMTGSIPGLQTNYPDGDWPTRSKIWGSFIDHVKTLTEFTGKPLRLVTEGNEETHGWPFLYMRSGRRMVGEYVMTQADIQLQTKIKHPIGMGYYPIDIYPARLCLDKDGVIIHEGELFSLASPGPYQIPYGALLPKREQIKNLLVPMRISASHVAYASIRMEATYMVMGEAAGVAAAIAASRGVAVQDIDRSALSSALVSHGQKIEWDGGGSYKSGTLRWSIFDEPMDVTPRWISHPEEYYRISVPSIWSRRNPKGDADP